MELITERLILREFVAEDAVAVLAYQSDPRYLPYNRWTDRRLEDVEAFVGMFLNQQRERPRIKYQLAITHKPDGVLIGNCGVRKQAADAVEAELGYELAPSHWGHGYATEAARAMLKFAFQELRVHRVAAWCIADNTASARVLERLGMRLEGRLREKENFKGRRWDSLIYGILESERKIDQ